MGLRHHEYPVLGKTSSGHSVHLSMHTNPKDYDQHNAPDGNRNFSKEYTHFNNQDHEDAAGIHQHYADQSDGLGAYYHHHMARAHRTLVGLKGDGRGHADERGDHGRGPRFGADSVLIASRAGRGHENAMAEFGKLAPHPSLR